jgi:hypothetical protein
MYAGAKVGQPMESNQTVVAGEIAEDVYVVVATKDGTSEYWAVALPYEEVLEAVERETGPGWKYVITSEWLTVERAVELGLPLRPICRIGSTDCLGS